MTWIASGFTAEVMARLGEQLLELVGRKISICRLVVSPAVNSPTIIHTSNTDGMGQTSSTSMRSDRAKGEQSADVSSRFDPNKTRIGILHRDASAAAGPLNPAVDMGADMTVGKATGSLSIEGLGVPTWAVVQLISDTDGARVSCRVSVAAATRLVAGYLRATSSVVDDVSMLPFDCGVLDYIVALLLRDTSFRLARSTYVECGGFEPASHTARCEYRDGDQLGSVYVDVELPASMQLSSKLPMRDRDHAVSKQGTFGRLIRQPIDSHALLRRRASRVASMRVSAAVLLGEITLQLTDVWATEVGDTLVTSLAVAEQLDESVSDPVGLLRAGKIDIPALNHSASATWSNSPGHKPGSLTLKEGFMSKYDATTISKVTSKGIADLKNGGLSGSDISEAGSSPIGKSDTPTPADIQPIGALAGVEIDVAIELGRFSLPLSAVVESGPGDVIHLDKSLSSGIRLRAGDAYIADGDLVNIDGNFGIRINKVY